MLCQKEDRRIVKQTLRKGISTCQSTFESRRVLRDTVHLYRIYFSE